MTDAADRMARAGDYVLGLMDDHQRERAERDMEVDAEFRDCVARLAVRIAALDRTAGEDQVPDRLWSAIEARLGGLPQMRGTPLADRAAEEGKAIDIVEASRRLDAKRDRARAMGGWRGWLVAASLLAACGVGYVGGRMSVEAPEPVVLVVLVDDQNVPGAIVEAFADDRVRIVPLTDFEVPPGKILQAWTLWDRAVGPVSLGTFASAREVVLDGPANQPVPVADQLYEITLEDAPGSYAGRPLGPILVKGLAKRPPA